MSSFNMMWIFSVYLFYLLGKLSTAAQVCPANCSNCKFDNRQLLIAATCVNVRLPNLPNSLTDLTFKDVTYPYQIFNGEFRSFYLSGKTELRILRLNNCGIKAFRGPCFQSNPKLTTLDLQDNLIYNIAEENFQGLVNLHYLDLSQNKLQNLTDFVFQKLPTLQELKILMNELSYIGENSLKGLNNIEKIDLQSNQINSIHQDAFTGLSSLTEISLQRNKLMRLEQGTFSKLDRLRAVNLRSNELIYIDSDSIVGTLALNSLNLAQNHLRTLTSHFLQKSSNLNLEINLSRNNLTILSNGDLTRVSLKTLYLVGNQISMVEPAAFKDSFIQKLDLQQNKLHHFPESIKNYINQSTIILLANNPWTCDCDIYWMASILTNQSQEPLCAEPINYKGWTVSNFSKNISKGCYFGSLPVPTKFLPQPPKQGIITPALETETSAVPFNTDKGNSSSISEPNPTENDNQAAFIAGGLTGFVLLIVLITVLMYVYSKHVHSKVHSDNIGYCEREDFNAKSIFKP